MYLYSYSLPDKTNLKELETRLSISFIKSIEGSFFFEQKEKMIFITKFNVITFIGYESSELEFIKSEIHLSDILQQDYFLSFDSTLEQKWIVNNTEIKLKEYSSIYLQIISLAISQSVGLEKYEIKLEDILVDSADIIQNYNHSINNRSKLSLFLKRLSMMRHEMWRNLLLLDKPSIVWENEDIELLYNKLEGILEIKSRYDIIEYKLRHLKDDIETLMDFISHKHSEFLEWIIILLIVFEIIMGLITFFKD